MKWFRDFMLLIWKNYTLLKSHRFLMLTELIATLLFPLLLLFFRHVIKPTTPQTYNYSSLSINKLPAFFESLFEKNTWEFAYVPSRSKAVKTIVEDVYHSLGIAMKVTGFSSEQSFENYIRYDNNSSSVLAAIIFNHDFFNNKDTLPLQVSYTLRFSNTARNLWYFWKNVLIREEAAAWHTDLLFPVFPEAGPRNPEFDDGGSPGYYTEGFLAIQHAVDKAIMRYHARNNATDLLKTTSVYIKRFPFPVASTDNFYIILTYFLPLTVGFVFSLMMFNLIRFVVWEKENQLKEYLRIMGISSLLLWSSYFFTYLMFLLLSIILLTLMLLVKIVQEPIICYSDGSLVFFFLMCSAIASILLGFVISTVFNSASTAAAIGAFIYFITHLPYIYIHSNYGVMSLHKKIISCLLSNVAILLGIQILIASEVSGKGIHWTKIFQPATNNDNLTIGHIIGMLIFDSFFYALLTWYIEAVFPGNYGIPQPWNFFMMNSYWFGTPISTVEIDEEADAIFKNAFIEGEPTDLEAQIQIKHLSKIFIINNTEKHAVNDLTLNFYKGQITVLLGSSGAGKTTILSMLIGMFPPTTGEAYICGYEISKEMVQIRKNVSFCPQYDILFDHMTVADHLYFYALLKGLTLKECHKKIEQTLTFFSLKEKLNSFSSSLTAGMKRELTISIALLGNSQVIILDEPTLRMDPTIRNNTWNLLQQHKHDHTIVLTTNNMTEADLLGDRIVIMVKGELQCCGSSFFLKYKYGAGYHMIVVKDLNCDIEEIGQIVEEHVPDAVLERDFATELYFSLPTENTSRFEALFTELESKQKDLGIVSFRVSVTTMEEVFLRANRLMDSTMNFQAIHLASSWDQNEKMIINQSKKGKGHFLKKKRTHIFTSNAPPLTFNTEYKLYYQQFHAMFNKRAIYYWRNWKMTLMHILAPVVLSSLLISSFSSLIIHSHPSLNLNLHKYGKTIVPYSISGNTSLLNKASDYLNIMLKSRGQKSKLVKGELEDFLIENRNCIEHCIVAISLKVTNGELIATALFNNQAYHSPATAVAVLDNILFMLLSGPHASVMVANKPQPFSVWNTATYTFLRSANGLQIAFSICFGLSPLISIFSLQIVSERISKVKHIQFVTGVYMPIFWLSALIWDLFIFFISCLLFLVVFKVCNIEVFYNHFMNILMIFMLYGWSIIPLMYLMSFLFLQSAAAYTKLILFNTFSGWTSFLFSFFVEIKAFYLRKYAETLSEILLVIPAYNLAMALSGFYDYGRSKALCDLLTTITTDCDEYNQSIYRINGKGIGKFLIAMAVLGFVFLFILFLIELYSWKIKTYFSHFRFKIYQMRSGNLKSDPAKFPSDEDVAREKEKVQECPKYMISSLNYPLIIRKLTKVHFKKVPTIAVDKLSLTVQKGECLGLFGFSGSGKTTIFKMLTGEETITSGDAFFENHSLCHDIGKMRKITGYCPQYSALLDHMTGREMLIMYARLRGIHEPYIKAHVEQILYLLRMGIQSDMLTKTYSGCTKRKLNNAIAFLGFPPIIFLDEPSYGMNPMARHLLWDLVTQTRESGKVIILSSQSIEECDVLCTRLAIMANGKLQYLGSPQYLKNKFSKGYTLMAKIKRDSKENEMENFKKDIMMKFTDSKIIQEHQGMIKFHIPSEDLSWAKVFGMMENIKNNYSLEDYSISQATMEHVFMTFTPLEQNK